MTSVSAIKQAHPTEVSTLQVVLVSQAFEVMGLRSSQRLSDTTLPLLSLQTTTRVLVDGPDGVQEHPGKELQIPASVKKSHAVRVCQAL